MPTTPSGSATRAASAARSDSVRPQARAVDPPVVLWMVVLTGLWGFNALSIKLLTDAMAPIMAAGLRGAIALALLVAYGLVRRERLLLRGALLMHSVIVGLLFGVEFVIFYSGARYTNGGHIAIFINMAPFFVAVGAHYLLPGDRMFPVRWLGLLLAFAGVVVLFWDDLFVQQTGYWRGDLMVILGSAIWAATTLYLKRFMVNHMTGFEMLYWQILVSTPLLIGTSLLLEPDGLAAISYQALALLLFQGGVVVFFSYLTWMTLLRVYPASAMQSFTFLTPVWGVLLGVLLLGESAGWLTAIGIALVGLGLLLVNRPRGSP